MLDSPFFSINYGWPIGSDGWGLGMDENLLVLSFLVKNSVNEIVVNAPPSETSGYSVFSTSDNLFYVYANGSSVFVEPVVGMEFNVLDDNTRWRWNGTSLEQVPTNDELATTISDLDNAFQLLVGRVENLEGGVGDLVQEVSDIKDDASTLEVTADTLTQTLSQWMTFVRSRSNHTGTQAASTISDFQSAVTTSINNVVTSQNTLDITYDVINEVVVFEVKQSVLDAKADTASLGTAAAQDVEDFDPSGAAALAQAHAVQRANHTGTQAISTVVDLQTNLDGKAPLFTPVIDYTGTGRDLLLSDEKSFIRASNAADITFTIPQESSVAWKGGTEIYFQQAGLGQVIFAAGAGVTLEVSPAYELKTKELMAVACLKKVGTNLWTLFGLLELAP